RLFRVWLSLQFPTPPRLFPASRQEVSVMRSLFRIFSLGLICLLLIAPSDAAINVYGYRSGRSPAAAQGASVLTVNPRAYQTPDSSQGSGLAVDSAINKRHGSTQSHASQAWARGGQKVNQNPFFASVFYFAWGQNRGNIEF